MKRKGVIVGSAALLALLLAAAAFVGGRLLSARRATDEGGPKVKVGTGKGAPVEFEWVPAAEVPQTEPDVAGAFVRKQDNSVFVDQTEGGFVISGDDDGSYSVTNVTGKVHEVVVAAETEVYVDLTLEQLEELSVDGKLHQQVEPGTIEEIGELSFVRAWGQKRGDRLVAEVLLYSRPPVVSR